MNKYVISALVAVSSVALSGCLFDNCTGANHDSAQAYAEQWTREMGLASAHVNCAGSDSDANGYVSCTVAHKDNNGAVQTIPIECAIAHSMNGNNGCRAARIFPVNGQ